MNASQLTALRQNRTVYADYISQKQRQAQGCATDTAYSQGGLDSSVLLQIQQGLLETPSTTTAAILFDSACPGCNTPPLPPPSSNGPPSILFAASNTSYLGIFQSNPDVLVFGTNDFTVEWFQYVTSNTNEFTRVFSIHPYSETQIGMSYEGTEDPKTVYLWYNNGSDFSNLSVNANVLDAWHHIAVTGSGGSNLKVFLDGSNLLNESVPYNIQNPGNWKFAIGAEEDGVESTFFDGYLTNFRVLNGTALYTSNFTVPSIPLTNLSNTQLLLLTSNGSTPFQDSSSNALTVNNLGSGLVSWSSNSPDFPF